MSVNILGSLLDAITKWSRFSFTVKPDNQYVEDDIFQIEFLNLISKYMILESCENPLPQLVEKLWQKQMESYTNPLLQLVEIESYEKHLLFTNENGKLYKSVAAACGN